MADEPNKTGNESAADGQAASSIALADLKTAGLAETYFTPDGGLNTKDLIEHLNDRTTLRTAAEERAADVPQDGKYDFGLPKDFKLPDGLKVSDEFLKSWSVSESKAKQFADFAKAQGYSQKEVSDFVRNWATADAAEKVASAKAQNDHFAAEMAKLGTNAKTRLENAQAFLDKQVGREMATALLTEITTAAGVEALEKLIHVKSGQLATNAGGAQEDANAQNKELAGRIGKENGMGKKLLDAHFAAQK